MGITIPQGAVAGQTLQVSVPAPVNYTILNVTIPNGATPGMVLSVQTAHGMQQITIPQGAVAGQTLQVSVPAPQPVVHAVHAVQPQAKPVGQQKVIPTYDVQQSQQNPVQIVSPATQMVSPQGGVKESI